MFENNAPLRKGPPLGFRYCDIKNLFERESLTLWSTFALFESSVILPFFGRKSILDRKGYFSALKVRNSHENIHLAFDRICFFCIFKIENYLKTVS